MKEISKARGIVLGKRKFKEKDLILDLLTEEGQRKVFRVHGILGSKNRNLIAYNPGNFLELDYYTRNNSLTNQILSVKETGIVKSHSDHFNSYKMLGYLSYILETIEVTSKEGGNHNLFLLLSGGLNQLIQSQNKTAEIHKLILFINIRCLKFLGVLDQATNCSSCGIKLYNYANWQFPEMHFLCQDCTTEPDINDWQVSLIVSIMQENRYLELLKNDFNTTLYGLDQDSLKALVMKLRKVIEHTLGLKLKTSI